MKEFQIGVISAIFVLGIAAVSCNNESSGVTQHAGIGNLGVNQQISDCGGFAAAGNMRLSPQTKNTQCSRGRLYLNQRQRRHAAAAAAKNTLCGDERLSWRYDPNSRTITFLNEDVWLNCCGEHSLSITLDETTGIYVIQETDAPGESRCLCLCFFDFSIDLPHMTAESMTVQLYRHITDEGPEQFVWQGTLDLSLG